MLDLQNLRFEDDVVLGLNIVIVPLASAPEYEALSYCWGSTDLCTGTLVSTPDGQEQIYRVSEHLATCLHSLITTERAEQNKTGYFWIDQIGINQEDVTERKIQVRLIAKIYKTASRVVVWLGQESQFDVEDVILDLRPDADI